MVFLPEEVSVALTLCRELLQAFHATPAASALKAAMIHLPSHDITQFKTHSRLSDFFFVFSPKRV